MLVITRGYPILCWLYHVVSLFEAILHLHFESIHYFYGDFLYVSHYQRVYPIKSHEIPLNPIKPPLNPIKPPLNPIKPPIFLGYTLW